MGLFRTKSIDAFIDGAQEYALKKSLGPLDLVFLGIGCIIGTGIFVLTGIGVQYAGPALSLSFVLAGLTCIFVAFCYAELASMVPIAGSSYTYAYAALGEIVAWVVGWGLVLEYTVGSAAVATGWSAYMVGLLKQLGIVLPPALTLAPAEGGIINLPAVFIIAVITCLLILGTRQSATVNKILVFIKIGIVLLFIILAVMHIKPVNWQPFNPYGFGGIAHAAAVMFFAYIGFDTVATAAEESRNPGKDMPVGIIGSLLIATFLYIAVALCVTGVVPWEQVAGNKEPVAFVMRQIGYNFGAAIVAIGAIVGITTVLLVFMYGQSRIFFAMSRDGLIPHQLCTVHPKFGTPYIVTLVAGAVVAALSGLLPIGVIADLTNMGTLVAFIMVGIGVMALRRTRPELPRPFRCPAVYIIAPLAVLMCAFLISNLDHITWLFAGVWFIIGLVVYFTYSRHHSTLNVADQSPHADAKI